MAVTDIVDSNMKRNGNKMTCIWGKVHNDRDNKSPWKGQDQLCRDRLRVRITVSDAKYITVWKERTPLCSVPKYKF